MRSVTRSISAPLSRGFTLIELMVVIVIIGVLAVAVSLSAGGRAVEDRMESDAKRVERLLRLAADEALAKGQEFGLRQTDEGFDFVTPDESSGGWTVLRQGLFRPRQIPEPFKVELRVEGQLVRPVPAAKPVPIGESADASEQDNRKEDKENRIEPVVLILSSGEMTPFVLDLKLGSADFFYRVEGNLLGELSTTRIKGDAG